MNGKVVAIFTEAEAASLTGVSAGQLRQWDRSGFFTPSFAEEDRSLAFSRLYSLGDLVALKALGIVKTRCRPDADEFAALKDGLRALDQRDWAGAAIRLAQRPVLLTRVPAAASHKHVEDNKDCLALSDLAADLVVDIRNVRTRHASLNGKIATAGKGRNRRAVIAGTSIPVETIKAFSNAGFSVAEIRAQYPSLNTDDIEAAIRFDLAA